jgi:putative membrane protein
LSGTEPSEDRDVLATHGVDVLAVRGAIGGTLMGLANLVPGISGGTMLLAAGVYPGFISAIAELTTLRFRARSLVLLGTIVTSAALGILLLAGTIKALVEDHRWIMYSLFIGLTLGGVPLVWRMARPASTSLALGAAGAFAAMLAMAFSSAGPPGGAAASYLLVFLSGLAAASAMILPGVSGGYLLLLLGQYEPILGTVDQLKRGLLGDATGGVSPDFALILDAMHVVIPLGLGVAAGVVGVSNLLRWLLQRFEKPTLGVLLGLLRGAVVGLWPFQEVRPPEPGDVVKGRVVTAENATRFSSEDWPLRSFEPRAKQVGTSLGLILLGLGTTTLIGRLGREAPEEPPRDLDPTRPAS